jgi:hypothetical protein
MPNCPRQTVATADSPQLQFLLQKVHADGLAIHLQESIVFEALANASFAHGTIADQDKLADLFHTMIPLGIPGLPVRILLTSGHFWSHGPIFSGKRYSYVARGAAFETTAVRSLEKWGLKLRWRGGPHDGGVDFKVA